MIERKTKINKLSNVLDVGSGLDINHGFSP